MQGALGRIVQNLPSLALLAAAVGGIGLHAVVSQSPQPLRLSVVGHVAAAQAPGQPIRIGRSDEAELRLLDPLVDEGIHAELSGELLVNRSATQRLQADGVELTELGLEPGDRLTLHVPKALSPGGGLRSLGRVASASAGTGTRPVVIEVGASGPWDRFRNGEALARETILRQAGTGREVPLDRLETYSVRGGLLVPGLLGFEMVSEAGIARRLQDGESLALGPSVSDLWKVRLKLEPPRRLLGRWPSLLVLDGTTRRRFDFGDDALDLGRWGRIALAGSQLRYRDLGLRAPLEIIRPGAGLLTPGRTRVHDGSVLKLGHTRYRLALGREVVRAEILPRGQDERLEDLTVLGQRLGDILPRHYDAEIGLREGSTCLTGGAPCEPGEDAFTLAGAARWSREGLVAVDLNGGALRVRALGSPAVRLRPGSGGEGRILPRRSGLSSAEELQRYERGEPLAPGDRLEVAGLSLEVRRPDYRALTALTAAGLGALLFAAALVYFALHRPKRLRFAGSTRTVYDLDPTSTRVRAIGQKVILPALPIPNLVVPAGAALTMAGMMLQLRFWVDPRLLGSADFFLRQCGALVAGLGLFLCLGLHRPRRRRASGSLVPQAGDPLGIDRHIWLGMLFLLLTNLLTAVGIGSRHNGFFFRIPGLGLTIQFSAFAKLFFAVGFARMFAHGLQIARGGDRLCFEPHQLTLQRALEPSHKNGRGLDLRSLLYAGRKVAFLGALLAAIFSFYIVQNDLGPGLIFTLTLTLFVLFVMGQYNRGVHGFLRFLGPQAFLPVAIAAMLALWLALPREMPLPDNALGNVAAPVLDKVMERLNLWWEPWRFTRGEQVVQSLWTVSGTAHEMTYFSNLHSDFAFSAAVHHYGFGGGLLLLGGLLVLFASGILLSRALFRVAEDARSPELYERSFTVIFACLVLIVEAAIHVGACLNFSPLTGVTLPFVSSGGSSLMVSWALLGLIGSRLAEDRDSTRAEAREGLEEAA
jgi:cell division protein FtsW (lipid II flippase)